jgi:DNA-binding transcriptional MerR regulator
MLAPSETPGIVSARQHYQSGEIFPRRFSSGAVADLAGITMRQLQWWYERGIAPADPISARRREYDFEQVLQVLIVARMRERRVAPAIARRLIVGVARDSRVRFATADDSELFLLIGKKYSRFAMSESVAIREMVARRESFTVIAIHELIAAIKSYKYPMRIR